MHHIIVLIFLVTGTSNVLLSKWTNFMWSQCSDGEWRYFQHPVVLTFLMFLGQFTCFIIFKCIYCILRRRNVGEEDTHFLTSGDREFKPMDMLLPALLNTITTILLLSGLYLTYASSFQVIRSAAIIFVGLLSSIHMNQMLIGRHWSAISTIIIAIIIIVFTDMHRVYEDSPSIIKSNDNANAILTGDLMILCATVFQAAKMVYEEKYLKACSVPILQAVGWQGLYGLVITLLLGICLNFMPATMSPFDYNSRGVFDDIMDVPTQIQSNPWLLLSLGLFTYSAVAYEFCCLTIIRFSSSANVLLADSLRTYFVWLFAVLLEWELVNFVAIIGFLILQLGLITYRRAIILEWYRSLLLRISRNRYSDMTADASVGVGDERSSVPASRPADVI